MNWLPRDIVVVPIDFSEDSFAALATALEMVEDSMHLHVVHVLASMEPAEPGVIWHTIDEASRTEHAKAALEAELKRRDYAVGRAVIRFGDPGHEIVSYAEQVDAGLVLVASHGKTGLERLLIGSVAERVVRLAHCPVLVIKR